MSKLDSPSAQRNKQPIWEILSTKVIPLLQKSSKAEDKPVRILEVAAGAGVHTEYFAKLLLSQNTKNFLWFPTDPTMDARNSIQCYIDENSDQLSQVVFQPLELTLSASGIQEESTSATLLSSGSKLDLIICINMIHISPWEATLGLMKIAGESLSDTGCLYCYGPYKIGGIAVESNL
jgi:hypothetical protein